MRKKRFGLGEFTVNGESLISSGIFRFQGNNYSSLTIEGMGYNYSPHDIFTNHLSVSGIFYSKKGINSLHITIEGYSKIKGNIHVQNAVISGCLKNTKGYFEAESINGDGALINDTEINVDTMQFDGYICAHTIYGDNISINSLRSFHNKKTHIHRIEADCIHVSGCDIQYICGKDIFIGDNCNIDYINCTNKLTISSKSKVNNFDAPSYEII